MPISSPGRPGSHHTPCPRIYHVLCHVQSSNPLLTSSLGLQGSRPVSKDPPMSSVRILHDQQAGQFTWAAGCLIGTVPT